MTILSRRHFLGTAGSIAAATSFGPEVWAQAKDRLVIGMSLEPTATSMTGLPILGSVGGRVGSEGLIVLGLTIEFSRATSRPLVNIGLGTVN